MNWIELKNIQDLESIKNESFQEPVMIFKHSTRCGTSALVKNKLERNWNSDETNGLKTYYLDLIRYRDISNLIESEFGVYHESPQVLMIRDGKAFFNASHFYISYPAILEQLVEESNS